MAILGPQNGSLQNSGGSNIDPKFVGSSYKDSRFMETGKKFIGIKSKPPFFKRPKPVLKNPQLVETVVEFHVGCRPWMGLMTAWIWVIL